ncbi:GbsR/MarR family transcriptional regulator [Leifsonia sp. NPDC058230]|uniref:GbsR/MarR family transcriptional regulator n=1 Tax=Leifsonia sp. NPDC058230 TaxID=3346391 RepID=UPI0036DAD397
MSDGLEKSSIGPASAAQLEFVQRFASAMIQGGAPPMASRVMASLLASDSGVMSSAELSQSLQVSQSGISGAVRFLIQLGFVRRERLPGSRMDQFRIRENVWHTVLDQRNSSLDEWRTSAQHGVELFGADSSAGRRLSEAVEFFDFIQQDMRGILERWDEHRRAREHAEN